LHVQSQVEEETSIIDDGRYLPRFIPQPYGAEKQPASTVSSNNAPSTTMMMIEVVMPSEDAVSTWWQDVAQAVFDAHRHLTALELIAHYSHITRVVYVPNLRRLLSFIEQHSPWLGYLGDGVVLPLFMNASISVFLTFFFTIP
jgi:hypothetical protein